MDFDLIAEEDYEDLPDEPELKFAALEQICRRSMNRLINNDTRPDYDQSVRLEYMAVIAAAADELGIESVRYPTNWENSPIEEFDSFARNVSGAVTRIRLRNRNTKKASVRLSARTRGKIELQIRRLRETIESADIDPNRRDALLRKLGELQREIEQPRSSLLKIMLLLGTIGAGVVVSSTSFLADAPDALTTITALVGLDKDAEDAELKRLGPAPQKALPAPTFESGGGDDIPF